MRLNFLDILAWIHCPKGAAFGYEPEWPCGDHELSKRLLNEWPLKTDTLREITPSRSDAVRWMQGTRYGLSRARGTQISPPATKDPINYWIGTKGYLTIDSINEPALLEFDLPGIHVVGDSVSRMYEIILVDTHPEPPTLTRWSDIVIQAAFLADCFREMTGEYAGVRFLAPAYEREEVINVPPQNIHVLAALLEHVRPLSVIRPGEHCNSTMPSGSGSRLTRAWRCPLREAGKCNPFNHNRPDSGG